MNDSQLISIITPVYNGACFLKETISSVLAQTYQNWEWFIIDDGSTDDTCKIVSGFKDDRINLVSIKHSGLPAVARNVGLKKAKGDFIAFLDADDLWMKDKLSRQIEKFRFDDKLLMICSSFEQFPEKNMKNFMLLNDRILSFKYLIFHQIIPNSSVMIKREVFDKIGYLDEDPRLKAVEDYDYWLRVLNYRNNSCLMLRRKLFKYRVHENNISNQTENNVSDWKTRLNVIFDKYKDYSEIYRARQRVDYLLKFHVLTKDYYKGIITNKDFFLSKDITIIDKMKAFVNKLISGC